MNFSASRLTPPVCSASRMRRINEVALLRRLHWLGKSSRVELAAALQLDTKTVTNLARDLLKQGCLTRDGLAASGRGRPRQVLRLNSRQLQAIGLHLTETEVRGARMDFDGRIRDRRVLPLDPQADSAVLQDALRTLAADLLHRADSKIMGIGLAFPGMLDADTGRILECAHLPAWKGVKVPDLFGDLTPGPFVFDTFTRAKALAEQWFGAAGALEDFILVDAGAGIGCALVTRGELQTGAARLGGELGHLIVNPRGARCRCGRRGCLETVCSLDTVMRAHNAASRAAALRSAGETMGLALANLAQVLNPAFVVITGALADRGPAFLEGIHRGLDLYCSPAIRRSLTVKAGRTGESGALLGSGVLVLRSLFSV